MKGFWQAQFTTIFFYQEQREMAMRPSCSSGTARNFLSMKISLEELSIQRDESTHIESMAAPSDFLPATWIMPSERDLKSPL
jgi:hypothetical protein